MNTKNVWNTYSDEQIKATNDFAHDYMRFLDAGKTERECIDEIIKRLDKEGYQDINKLINSNRKIEAGDRVYSMVMNKSIAIFNIGEAPIEQGMNILGAHIDSPRIDVKQNPLYEDSKIAYLDTHYYGGIKKYQWVAIPLAMHGVVVKKDGTIIEISIGEDEDEPVFFISDLLVHLSAEQMDKKAAKVIEGEQLDLVIGTKPIKISDEDMCKCTDSNKSQSDSELVKKAIVELLRDSYGFEEDDFMSAELSIVPAGKCREAGLDRSMILGYGHDDRVCSYASLMAFLDANRGKCKRTSCCILVDKEEIGSVGATGMESKFFENSVAELINLMEGYNDIIFRRCMANSNMLSSDVNAAYDPTFSSVFEKRSASFMGNGMVINKFTGSRGKSMANDANAEYVAHLRNLLDENNVIFQMAEMGKVDVGGGGTIAYILAAYGMHVIDCGVAVLNMHAPWEAISKVDLYETYRGYKAFLENASFGC